jgi:hypothetical protein
MRKARQGNRGRPDSSILVTGKVKDYDTTDDTYSVEANGEVFDGCRNMVGPAASFLGLRVSSRIPVGTFVVLLPQDPPLILNTGAIEFADKEHCHDKQMTGTGVKDLFQDTAGVEPGMPQGHTPNDLAEGEFEWSRANGPLFRFLTSLVALGASDLAKIEFNLHRELVRLTSKTFQHFSACGDTNEYDDGTLNQEEHGTSYAHERMGLVKEGDEIMSVDEAPDLDEWMKRTGNWRWSQYRGFLGDLVNHWCTDPQEAAGELFDAANHSPEDYRSGKWREYIGHDGSFLMESCGEIALEKVTRIPVPIRLKHEEDPDGVTRRLVKELDASFLKQWKWDKKNPHYTAFMLRDYARYLSRFQSLARFHQMADAKGEFYVPKESETPQPLDPKIKPDREPIVWIDVYATIRIMHDGSIVTVDGYGNTTFSGPPGIIYSSVADIQFYAARDIVHKAGRSVFINGRRHVEIAANRGSILLKARTGLRALVERGVLWLKSDYDPEVPYTPAEGDPEADVHADVGVIVQCEKAGMLSRSLENCITTTGAADTTEGLKIKSEKFRLNASTAEITVAKNLDIKGQKIRLNVMQIVSAAVNLLWFKGMLKLNNGRMELRSIIADGLRVNSPIAATSSVVGEIEAETILEDPGDPDNELPEFEAPPADVLPVRPWALFAQEEYKPLESLYEPLTQQRARLDEELRRGDAPDFEEWEGMTDALLSSSWTTTGGAPWPGKGVQWLSYTPEYDELGAPSDTPCEDFKPLDGKPNLAPITYHFVP